MTGAYEEIITSPTLGIIFLQNQHTKTGLSLKAERNMDQ